ncbi:EcsC family protein [Bacillaceae bacterium W0354]
MGEERVLKEINKWEADLENYVTNDFESLYEMWVQNSFKQLPHFFQKRFYEFVDQWFLYTYTFIQSTNAQNEAKNRILQIARTYDETIETIEDLQRLSIDQLTYLADQQVAKNRVYSFTQGGITGTGGWLFLGVDLPLIVALNLRSVQLIGSCFGYNMNNPIEMVIALKVFHAGTLPKRMQYQAWIDLKKSTENLESVLSEERMLTDQSWFEQPLNQIFKTIAIVSFKKKLIQGIPLISVGIGAITNYRLAKQVTDLAKRFYQHRLINERNNESLLFND